MLKFKLLQTNLTYSTFQAVFLEILNNITPFKEKLFRLITAPLLLSLLEKQKSA